MDRGSGPVGAVEDDFGDGGGVDILRPEESQINSCEIGTPLCHTTRFDIDEDDRIGIQQNMKKGSSARARKCALFVTILWIGRALMKSVLAPRPS